MYLMYKLYVKETYAHTHKQYSKYLKLFISISLRKIAVTPSFVTQEGHIKMNEMG